MRLDCPLRSNSTELWLPPPSTAMHSPLLSTADFLFIFRVWTLRSVPGARTTHLAIVPRTVLLTLLGILHSKSLVRGLPQSRGSSTQPGHSEMVAVHSAPDLFWAASCTLTVNREPAPCVEGTALHRGLLLPAGSCQEASHRRQGSSTGLQGSKTDGRGWEDNLFSYS